MENNLEFMENTYESLDEMYNSYELEGIRRKQMYHDAHTILFSSHPKDSVTAAELRTYGDTQLEAFVRSRLGPFRFDFHADTAKSKAKNYYILSLFDDVFSSLSNDDHDHTPVIHAYKGALYVGPMFGFEYFSFDDDCYFSGHGTVEILMIVLKKHLHNGMYFNGSATK